MKTHQVRKAQAACSEFAIAKESPPEVWQRLESQAGKWESFIMEGKEGFLGPDWRLLT